MARTGPNFRRYIQSIEITNPGNGYSSSDPPTVYVSPPDSTVDVTQNIQAVVSLEIANNVVESISITEPGDGYATIPDVKLIGSLSSVSFDSQVDENRDSGTFLNVSAVGSSGVGSGALFRIVVNNVGEVTGATVTTKGTGYAEGDIIYIADTAIGGDGSARNIELEVTSISGGGSGAIFTPSIDFINRPQQYFHQNTSYITEFEIPEWVRIEYPKYAEFIKAYFSFMDADDSYTASLGTSTASPNYVLQELIDRFSVSHYHGDFLESLLQQYAIDFPEDKQMDTRFLIKRIRDFYSSKGSSESIKTFFRMVYGEEVDVFKPYEYVLRPSDGIWSEETSIKVYQNIERTDGELFDPLQFRGRKVDIYYYDSTGSITARVPINTSVLRAKKIAYTNPTAFELTIDVPAGTDIPGYGVEGDISAVLGGKISSVTNIGTADPLRVADTYDINSGFTTNGNGAGAEFTVVVDGVGAASITVDTVGDDYAPGETITIPDSLLGSGGAVDLTFDVDDITEGKIYSVTILNGGQGYSANPDIAIIPDNNDRNGISTPAVLGARLTAGVITEVVIIEGGEGYNNQPALQLSTSAYRTYVANENTIDNINNKLAFLTRVLNSVSVVSDSGAANGGFKVGNTFKVSESGDILGVYAIDYFAEDYTLTGIDNNAYVRVTAISSSGYPTNYEIIATGVGFQRPGFNFTITSDIGETAIFTCATGFAHTYPGRFKDSRGFLSDANRLQDNKIYQSYSYQVRSSLSKGIWGELLTRTANPAGMVAFSDLQILHNVDFGITFNVVPDLFAFRIFVPLDPVEVSELVELAFHKPAITDSFSTQDDEAFLEPGLVKNENPDADDTVYRFDVTTQKSENPDISENVAKDFEKNNITDSVDMTELVLLVKLIQRFPIDSTDVAETVLLALQLNKTDDVAVDDDPSLEPQLVKTESAVTADADTLTIGLNKTETPDMNDSPVFLFDGIKADDYEVSDAGVIYMQNYINGDYFAEDYVESYPGVSSTTF